MHYLIDGYNFLFWQTEACPRHETAWLERGTLQQARDQLIDFLCELSGRSGLAIELVFDAPSSPSSGYDRYRPIQVLYSPEGLSADEWMLERAFQPRTRLCFVTNDRRLRGQLSSTGAHSISIEEFLSRSRRAGAKNQQAPKPSHQQSSRWQAQYIALFEKRYRSLYD